MALNDSTLIITTSSSTIAEKPRCMVGQFWRNVTGRRYFRTV